MDDYQIYYAVTSDDEIKRIFLVEDGYGKDADYTVYTEVNEDDRVLATEFLTDDGEVYYAKPEKSFSNKSMALGYITAKIREYRYQSA